MIDTMETDTRNRPLPDTAVDDSGPPYRTPEHDGTFDDEDSMCARRCRERQESCDADCDAKAGSAD